MNFKTASVLFLLFFVHKAHAFEFYELAMLRLNDAAYGKQETLSQFKNQPIIASFFMPNCSWCEKQHKALKLLKTQCPEVRSIMLGINGNNRDLKRALRKKRNHFPAFVSHPEIVKALGGKPPVPMALVFNKYGKLTFYTQGYNSATTLEDLMKENHVSSCKNESRTRLL